MRGHIGKGKCYVLNLINANLVISSSLAVSGIARNEIYHVSLKDLTLTRVYGVR